MAGVGSVQETLVLEGEMPSCGGELSHTCFCFYSVLEAPEAKRSSVSSKVAYNTSREVQLLLCSLYLQCVPEVEDLKAGAY